MTLISTRAILLKRIGFGDYDIIVTMYTIDNGMMSAIAKSAKNSTKRFAGVLEPFSLLDVICKEGKNLSVLMEAYICDPFLNIRRDVKKTAYASYWNELVYISTMEGESTPELYRLLSFILSELDGGNMPSELYSVIFQMRFLSIIGFMPNLQFCGVCKKDLDLIKQSNFSIDLSAGGVCCEVCRNGVSRQQISKGTLKQLSWIASVELDKALRIRFSHSSLVESLTFLESFVPYYIGTLPKSLGVLGKLRKMF